MTDLRTISPDELAPLSEVAEDLHVVAFSPSGPLQALPYEKLLTKLIATNLVKASKAALEADLAHPADSVALVFNDPTAALNGWYRKVGASGAGNWSQFEELARAARIDARAWAEGTAPGGGDTRSAREWAQIASAAAAALGTPPGIFRTVTANAVAEPFDFIAADTSAGSFPLTLPAAGGFVSVRDIANAWETNPLTIIGNGRTIDGNPTLLADLSGFDVEFASFGPVWRYSLKPMYGG